MKSFTFFLLLGMSALFTFSACEKEKIVTVDSTQPDGDFTSQRMGTLVAQNGTPTKGTAQIGTDEAGEQFINFSSDFMTELGTGTVTLYLSKSMDYMADPGNGNPNLRIVGLINKNGAQYHKVNTTAGSDFNHVIIWCGSASVPFGYAKLQ